MTEHTIVAFDPGKITGVAAGVFSDDKPVRIIDSDAWTHEEIIANFDIIQEEASTPDHVVSEVFILLQGNEFTADLTGVRIEGVLEAAYGLDRIVWRGRSMKEQVPDQVLKDNGFWVTGSDIEWEDGRDANDAIKHLIGHVAFTLHHRPTLEAYFRDRS